MIFFVYFQEKLFFFYKKTPFSVRRFMAYKKYFVIFLVFSIMAASLLGILSTRDHRFSLSSILWSGVNPAPRQPPLIALSAAK